MAKIYETKHFIVEASEKPHVDRNDGGHIRLFPKNKVLDRMAFSSEMAIKFIRLTMVVGSAMKTAMTNRGIEIMRINFQDMGNWAFKTGEEPFLHMHIYGRAKNAKHQPYKEAVQLPDRSTNFYDGFERLNDDDIKEIRKHIELIFNKKRYSDSEWGISAKR